MVPDADRSYTYRLNFDDTITPTLLFHFGAGLLYYNHPDLGYQAPFTPGQKRRPRKASAALRAAIPSRHFQPVRTCHRSPA